MRRVKEVKVTLLLILAISVLMACGVDPVFKADRSTVDFRSESEIAARHEGEADLHQADVARTDVARTDVEQADSGRSVKQPVSRKHPLARSTDTRSTDTNATFKQVETNRSDLNQIDLERQSQPDREPLEQVDSADKKQIDQKQTHLERMDSMSHLRSIDRAGSELVESEHADLLQAGSEKTESEASIESGDSKDFSPEQADLTAADFPASLGENLKTLVAIGQGIPSSALWVKRAEVVEWSDSCLEVAGAERTCDRVRTPGYRVVLSTVTETFEFHTDRAGGKIYRDQ